MTKTFRPPQTLPTKSRFPLAGVSAAGPQPASAGSEEGETWQDWFDRTVAESRGCREYLPPSQSEIEEQIALEAESEYAHGDGGWR